VVNLFRYLVVLSKKYLYIKVSRSLGVTSMDHIVFSFSQKYLQCAILKCAALNVWGFTTNVESMPMFWKTV